MSVSFADIKRITATTLEFINYFQKNINRSHIFNIKKSVKRHGTVNAKEILASGKYCFTVLRIGYYDI